MDFKDMCPRYLAAMSFLGKKWTGLILRSLMEGPRRFTEMSAYVPGLSDRLLSQRLQELEEAGIVERRVYSQRPVLVEYSLTAQGQALREVVEAIQHWADVWGGTTVAPKSQIDNSTKREIRGIKTSTR
jgi:DNA-binding HxlR family transcriptional regulator